MAFLFNKKSSGDSKDSPTSSPSTSPASLMKPTPVETQTMRNDPMALASPLTDTGGNTSVSFSQPVSTSLSRQSSISGGPTFHSGSFSGSLDQSLGPLRGISGVSAGASFSASTSTDSHSSAKDENSLTPPPPVSVNMDIARPTSQSVTATSTTSISTPSSVVAPASALAATSSSSVPVSSSVPNHNSSLQPPVPTMGSYGILGTKVSASGSVHNIYQTNVVMTPGSSLPNTPTPGSWMPSGHAAHLSSGGMDFSGLSSGGVVTPSRSPNASPPITQQYSAATSTQQSTNPPSSSSSSSSQPPAHPQSHPILQSTTPVNPPPSVVTTVIPDEVTSLRAMFQSVPGLSRSTFQLGDTLGTGTFGRVRIVSYQNANTNAKSTPSHSPTQSPTIAPQGARTAPSANVLYFALKMLKKSEIIRLKQVEHIKAEKSILSRITHPFIVHLYAHFQDDRYLYMLMNFVQGGELFSQLRRAGRFSDMTAKFYACEIVSALEYLHSIQICYRDLKPENLLIDRDGHIKITDFGFAKVVEDRTWTLCGTPEYLAPEIIQSKGHNKAVDWWALGILIFEMLAGYPPFYDENPFGIYQKILKGVIDFPKHMDPNAKDLIRKLLTADRTKRFGCLHGGAEDVKRHPWFHGLDWQKVVEKKYKPPFIPPARAQNDTSNFDRYPDSRESSRKIELTDKEKALFEDF